MYMYMYMHMYMYIMYMCIHCNVYRLFWSLLDPMMIYETYAYCDDRWFILWEDLITWQWQDLAVELSPRGVPSMENTSEIHQGLEVQNCFTPSSLPSAGQMWQGNKSGNSRTIIELHDGFSTMFDTRHCQTGASQSPIFSDFLVEETGSPSRWILPACCPALVAPAGPAKVPREGDVFAPGNSMINRALLVDEPKWLIYMYIYIYICIYI